MRGTHLYAQETNLTRRVTAWEDKLLPVLRDQHSRPRFDIHEYGTRLLETLSIEVAKNVVEEQMQKQELKESEGCIGGDENLEGSDDTAKVLEEASDDVTMSKEDVLSKPFIAIAAKQQASRYEVCRLFLSMLQLANDRNVELSHETVNSEGMDELPSLDAVADRLTDSLRVKLLSMAKAVDMEEYPGVDHTSAQYLDEDVTFVTQVTQEQEFGESTIKAPQELMKGGGNSTNKVGSNSSNNDGEVRSSAVGCSIFDEGLVKQTGISASAHTKTSRKRSAMGNLMNRSGSSLASRF